MSCRPPAVLSLLALLLASRPAAAVPGDEQWDDTWALPGTDGAVNAIVEFQGDLVIAGEFRHVGNVAASAVAIYDGSTWAPLDEGLDGEAYAAVVWNGDLYVGGYFDLPDGTPGGGLARWDGNEWIPSVGGGVDDVSGLVVYGGQLVVTGPTEVDGGTTVGSIAGWNGTSWSTFSGGTEDGYLYAAATDGTNLYVTGEFAGIGFSGAANVAKWNGSTWNSMGGGLTDEFGDPFGAYGEDVHVWNGQVIVTGGFVEAGGTPLENFAAWNGSSWGPLGDSSTFFPNGAYRIGDWNGDLLVSDDFAVQRWNGSYWSSLGWYVSAFAYGTYGSDLVIGGLFSAVIDAPARNVARYDGSDWTALAGGHGAAGPVDVVYEWNGQMIAGGNNSTRYGDVTGSMVAAWDGTQWNAMGDGLQGSFASYTVRMATYQGDLVVNGVFDMSGATPVSRFARWDGSSWSQVGDGSPNGATDMAVAGGALYGVIYNPGSFIARLNDGTNEWDYIGDSTGPYTFSCLGEYDGKLVVAGGFPEIEGVPASGIATWDGAAWAPLGAGVGGGVNAMAELGGKLYVGGSFSTVGGGPGNYTAVWDGTTWTEWGGGLDHRVFDLTILGGDLFVTGELTNAGGIPANHIARWDGSTWSALGSGLDGFGQSVAAIGGQLRVGGDFTVAGGTYSAGIASWNPAGGGTAVPETAGRIGLAASPNPFRGAVALSFELPRPQEVTVRVINAAGRRVVERRLGALGAGRHSFRWDGRDDDGRRVATGAYFVEVRGSAGRRETGKVMLVR